MVSDSHMNWPSIGEESFCQWGFDEPTCAHEDALSEEPRIVGWKPNALAAIAQLAESISVILAARIQQQVLERKVMLLDARCEALEVARPTVVPIQTLAPFPYRLVKPFEVLVTFHGDHYVASFVDANIGASGDTDVEAVLNLKDMLVSAFEMLAELNDDELGPGPCMQKHVLEEFIRRAERRGRDHKGTG